MGRMHSKGKGISRRCLPYRKAPPSWVHVSAQDLTDQMVKLAKRGSTPSQIGVLLRDQYGIPQVKGVTGSKILRILKVNGVAPTLPEDLYHLIKKAHWRSASPQSAASIADVRQLPRTSCSELCIG